MLFKPLNEATAPRHTFEDEEFENSQRGYVPEITVAVPELKADYLLVAPHNIGVVLSSIPDSKKIGSINIVYTELAEAEKENTDDYDEDEQLYAAMTAKTLRTKYPDTELPIFQHKNIVSVIVPHFQNVIVSNLLAQKLVKHLPIPKVITLSPCSLNNRQSLNKIVYENSEENANLSVIPPLKPPHFITGTVASVIGELQKTDCKITSLILNSEGQPGYEKIDNDSVVDAAYVLGDLLLESHKEYLKKVSLEVRRFNSYSSSSMYV